MHIKGLYTYRIAKREKESIDATISINESHPIYGGHFPGHPITPGVCQVSMVREILEEETGIPLMMSAAKLIKFTAIHEPGVDPEINAAISFSRKGEHWEVSAHLHKNEKVFLKFKGEFKDQK